MPKTNKKLCEAQSAQAITARRLLISLATPSSHPSVGQARELVFNLVLLIVSASVHLQDLQLGATASAHAVSHSYLCNTAAED